MARTDNLNNFLTDVANAIRTKTGSSEEIQASNFDTEISTIPTPPTYPFDITGYEIKKQNATQQDIQDIATWITNNSNYDVYIYTKNKASAFYNGTFTDASALDNKLKMKIVGGYDNSGGTDGAVFDSCSNMTRPPIIDFCSSSGLTKMFYGCSSLVSLPSSYFSSLRGRNDTFNIIQPQLFTSTFEGCTSLTTLEGTQLNYLKPFYINRCFKDCSSLTTFPFTNLSNCGSMNNVCDGCTSLTDVPVLTPSTWGRGVNVGSAFTNCPNLTQTSVDNILNFLANCTAISGGKKMSRIFSSGYGYLTKVQNSPYYTNIVNAGWNIDITD